LTFIGYYIMGAITLLAIVIIGEGRLWNGRIPEELVRFKAWYQAHRKEPRHIVIGDLRPQFLKDLLSEPEWMYDAPQDSEEGR